MVKIKTKKQEPVSDVGETFADKGDAQLTGTLLRGLAIMDILIPIGHPMTLAEVAADAKLDLSTTLRLMRALEGARQIIRVGDGKRYVASPKAMRPLPLLHPLEQVRREAAPIIRELASKVSKTVVFVAFLGVERVVVEVMQSPGSLSPYYSTWLQGPLHATGPGKALLLSMNAERRRALLGDTPYASITASTITDAKAFDEDMELSARRGYVLVRNENYEGLTAMAANFQTWGGRAVGCITLTGHSSEFDENSIETMASALTACARLIPMQVSLKMLEELAGRS